VSKFPNRSLIAWMVNGALPSERLLANTSARRFSATDSLTNSTVSRPYRGACLRICPKNPSSLSARILQTNGSILTIFSLPAICVSVAGKEEE
jgi:hypothetical protein